MNNHGLTTTHRIPSTGGAGQEPKREVNTLPPKEPEPTTAEPCRLEPLRSGVGGGMKHELCPACETCAHCLKKGCIPIQPAPPPPPKENDDA